MKRNWMRRSVIGCQDPGNPFDSSTASLAHAEPLAILMDRSYDGTIDHEGESAWQCLQEMRGTLQGKYGPCVQEASFVSFRGSLATSACLVTWWKERALLAFSMTDPVFQGEGRGEFLIRKSMHALRLAGYSDFYLVVTAGNAPAERLYRRLGFEFQGEAIPGR